MGAHSNRLSIICAVLNRAHEYFSAGAEQCGGADTLADTHADTYAAQHSTISLLITPYTYKTLCFILYSTSLSTLLHFTSLY